MIYNSVKSLKLLHVAFKVLFNVILHKCQFVHLEHLEINTNVLHLHLHLSHLADARGWLVTKPHWLKRYTRCPLSSVWTFHIFDQIFFLVLLKHVVSKVIKLLYPISLQQLGQYILEMFKLRFCWLISIFYF
jgi:hypothetical protein